MKRYTQAERQQFISKFQRSAMSAVAFCRAQGISTVSLSLWRKRYGTTRGVLAEAAAAPWVPVVLRSEAVPSPPSPQMEHYALIAPSARLEVPRGFDAREVGALWQIITAAPAASGAEVAA
jgi:transposase-like protein